MDKDEANQLYGRMMEACDIELAIESGQFKTLDDVFQAVTVRAKHIEAELREAGVKMARSLTMKQFAEAEKQVEQHLALVQLDTTQAEKH